MFNSLEHENGRVRQFQDCIQEEKCLEAVEKLLRKAFEKVMDINLYEGSSMYETTPTSSGNVYFLKINKVFENKRRIIYELVHEMGHLFDTIPLDRNIDRNSEHPASERSREIRAWAFADEEFKKYPELIDFTQEYIEHKRTCLLSYEIVI